MNQNKKPRQLVNEIIKLFHEKLGNDIEGIQNKEPKKGKERKIKIIHSNLNDKDYKLIFDELQNKYEDYFVRIENDVYFDNFQKKEIVCIYFKN